MIGSEDCERHNRPAVSTRAPRKWVATNDAIAAQA